MSDLLHFEDFHLGQTFSFGRYEVSEAKIVEFAKQFDPQPHHLDEVAAKKTILGGLAASGWHVCAMTMRMVVDGLVAKTATHGGAGAPEARWLKPVRPGDILRVEGEVVDMKASKSRPGIGFITFRFNVFNTREQVAMIAMTPIVARKAYR